MPAGDSTPGGPANTSRALLLALAGLVLVALLVFLRDRPPPPAPADAPATEFSATRAANRLATLLGDEAPHPIGSPAHVEVRDRLLAELRALGLSPQVQVGTACERGAECGAVENVLARIDGSAHGGALLLSAHYDSVPAGPGASDDGAGVAALLEIARALRAGPLPAHDLILLFSDGEEAGLLGARVFVAEHPWAGEVRAAVNLEARGTRGPSFMFETGSRNAALIADYGARVTRPITNSIFYAAYRLLPNDTDFTIYKARDWQGYNYAFIDGVQNYHTPRDDLAHLSRAALQHQGDNALGVSRALLNEPWPEGPASEAVYVDLLALGLLHWPAALALPLAIGLALAWAAALLRLRRLGWLRPRELARGMLLAPPAMMIAALLVILLIRMLRARGALPPAVGRYDWTATPLPLLVASALLAASALIAVTRSSAARGTWGVWVGSLLWLVLATLAGAVLLPGLSFALLLPAGAALLGALPALIRRRIDGLAAACLPALLLAALVLLPTLRELYPLLGVGALPLGAALGVWTLLPATPLLAGAGRGTVHGLLGGCLVAALAAGIWAARQPAYSPTAPQRLNLLYALDADSGRAEWLSRPDSGAMPAALLAVEPFAARTTPPFPWTGAGYFSAPATAPALPAPTLELLATEADGDAIRYRTRLRSPRGARAASLCFMPEIVARDLSLDGHAVGDNPQQSAGRCLHLQTLAADGVELAFTTDRAPVGIVVADRSADLPEAGRKLLAARPRSAVASREGDQTLVLKRYRLSP